MSTISDALKKAQQKREYEKEFESLDRPEPLQRDALRSKKEKPKKRSYAKVTLTLLIVMSLFGGTFLFTSEPEFMEKLPNVLDRLNEFELPFSLFSQQESVSLTALEERSVPFKDANDFPAQTVLTLHRSRMLSPTATGPVPTLSGIMFIMDDPRAVLNGKTRFAGDTVAGYLIKEIHEDRVLLNNGKNDITLRLE